MKNIFLLLVLTYTGIQAMEYEVLFENERVAVSRVKIMPGEQIGDHYDLYPQVVYALQGWVITRLENNGSMTDVYFPTHQAVHRPSEGPEKMHPSVNNTSEPIEIIIYQMKQ